MIFEWHSDFDDGAQWYIPAFVKPESYHKWYEDNVGRKCLFKYDVVLVEINYIPHDYFICAGYPFSAHIPKQFVHRIAHDEPHLFERWVKAAQDMRLNEPLITRFWNGAIDYYSGLLERAA